MSVAIRIAVALAVIIPAVLWNGFVLHVLWRWFVVPLGMPEIGVLHAIGLVCVVSTFKTKPRPEKDDRPWYESVGVSVVGSLTLLGVGYLIKSGM